MLVIAVVCILIGLVNSQTYTSNTCGLRPLVDHNKIVGGNESLRGDWAWSCSLRQNGRHICGGSIISSQWVITAAHCLSSANPSPALYTVVCGLHDRLISDPWTVEYRPIRLFRHPNYNSRLIQHDLALIQISNQPIALSNYILPACYPDVSDTYAGAISVATGWGTLFSGGTVAPTQREVEMIVLRDSDCNDKFDQGSLNMLDPLTQVCAGETGENKDTCQGDSGGPLVVRHANGLWYLIGLTSWGFGCGDGGVYCRTSAYRNWVEQYTGPLPTGVTK